jgi:hypothetical protein
MEQPKRGSMFFVVTGIGEQEAVAVTCETAAAE